MKTPEIATTMENWEEVIMHREDVLLEDIDIFKDYLVVSERTNGLNRIRIMPWSGEGNIFLPLKAKPIQHIRTTM
jgi:oligopeptidase B